MNPIAANDAPIVIHCSAVKLSGITPCACAFKIPAGNLTKPHTWRTPISKTPIIKNVHAFVLKIRPKAMVWATTTPQAQTSKKAIKSSCSMIDMRASG